MSYPNKKIVPWNEPYFIGGQGGGDATATYSQNGLQADNPGGGLIEGIGPAPLGGPDFPIGGEGSQAVSGPDPVNGGPMGPGGNSGGGGADGGGGGMVKCDPKPTCSSPSSSSPSSSSPMNEPTSSSVSGMPSANEPDTMGASGSNGQSMCDGDGMMSDGMDEMEMEREMPSPSSSSNAESGSPIRYANGEVRLVVQDLLSFGYGHEWGHTRTYSNQLNANAQGPNGDRWFVKQMPHLEEDGNGNIAVIGVINDTVWFDSNLDAYFFVQDTLEHNTTNDQYLYRNLRGEVFKFFDFSGAHPTAKQGKFKSYTDPHGHETTVGYDTDNRIDEFAQSSGSETSRYVYQYNDSGDNPDRLSTVELQRGTTSIRRAVYTYYGSSESDGSAGDLKTAAIEEWDGSSWAELQKSYYRYYESGDPNGFAHGLKFVVGPEAYQRMVDDGFTPETADDSDIDDYADHYFEYDSSKRVTREDVNGGLLSYTYAYSSSSNADAFNNWATKTTETLPDGNTRLVYTNYAGQVMLKVLQEDGTSNEWYEYFKYDSDGRVTLHANSSAVSSWSESDAGLVTLKNSAGFIRVFDYYTTTDIPNGKVAGFLQFEKIKQGDSGSEIKLREYKYTERTANGTTVHPIAEETAYRSELSGGSDPVTTSYSYTWYSGTVQMESRTITWPAVDSSQNGSGSTTSREEQMDVYGRRIWLLDERGHIFRWKWDDASGGLTQRIEDVDTDEVTDAPWTNTSGLHLVFDYNHDNLGRPTEELGPSHHIDTSFVDTSSSSSVTSVQTARWWVYQDSSHELWEGRGYHEEGGTDELVNPVRISKLDRLGRLSEAILAVRGVTDGKLSESDSFSQGDYVRWTKFNYDKEGRLTDQWLYFSIPSSGDGTEGTNYAKTAFQYDAMLRLERIKMPGTDGTIQRIQYDPRGLPSKIRVGTDDSGTSSDDMVDVTDNEYDNGSDGGDGNLTKRTQHVNGSSSDRVTTFGYDWRNRQTSVDGEIDFYEAYTYNNLDQVTVIEQKDTDSGGDLVAKQEFAFDNLGRVYQVTHYGVSGGSTTGSIDDQFWYDAAGNLIKQRPAGNRAFQKMVYDGVGRLTKRYLSYDLDESSYSDADDVSGDTVIEQTELNYDEASNLIKRTLRKRFHDATGTGELGAPGTSPEARVYYMAFWPDPIGREKARADYGTNGGSFLFRPSTVPSRSDTVLVTSTDYNDDGEAFEFTDPEAIARRLEFDDAGRLTKEIFNYVDGSPSGDSDQTVIYAYNEEGLVDKITAKNGDTGDQITEYFYGTTKGSSASDVARSDLVREVAYPDSGGSSDRVVYTYNRQGQVKTKSDQAGTEHTYEYDKLARLKHDRVTALGSGIDSSVKRLTLSYTVRGLLHKLTHYDNSDTSMGSVVNEVEREYNAFGRIKKEYQEHSGAVDTNTSLRTVYTYADGTDNTIRRESIEYPDGRTISFTYGSTDGTNDVLSRVETIKQGTTTYATYTYLGRSRSVKVAYGEPGVELTFIKLSGESDGDAGDQYTGLDRFGRVVDMRWLESGTSNARERVKYGFDRNSNRKWRENLVASSDEDEFYTYDDLFRLTNRQRGDLNSNKDGISGTPPREEDFGLDPTGNWNQYVEKTSGSTDLDQSRDMNAANEITDITESSGTAWPTPSQDDAGNLTKVPKPEDPGNSFDLTYDAWNRLIEVIDSGGTVEDYRYDGMSRRVKKTVSGRDIYYSDKWQILEEYDGSGTLDKQNVWGARYTDDLVVYDADGASTRRYALHDYFNVTATVDDTGSVDERYGYEAYGSRRVMDPSFQTSSSTTSTSATAYGAYVFDAESGLYQARNRYLHPKLGRWMSRDPIGYQGGINLYGYAGSNPVNGVDANGTLCCEDFLAAFPKGSWKKHTVKLNAEEGRSTANFVTITGASVTWKRNFYIACGCEGQFPLILNATKTFTRNVRRKDEFLLLQRLTPGANFAPPLPRNALHGIGKLIAKAIGKQLPGFGITSTQEFRSFIQTMNTEAKPVAPKAATAGQWEEGPNPCSGATWPGSLK